MVFIEVVMKYTVTLKNIHKEEPKEWAREHCKSYLSCTMHGTLSDMFSTFVDYHFSNDKDAFWFKMRWQ
jgi:hypothetical protein